MVINAAKLKLAFQLVKNTFPGVLGAKTNYFSVDINAAKLKLAFQLVKNTFPGWVGWLDKLEIKPTQPA